MGVNAYTDTFKFTTPIFPNTVYTWNPEAKIASWESTAASQEEIDQAFALTGLPKELYEQFKTYIQVTGNSGETLYDPEEVQKYLDNGTWKLVH